MKKDISKFHRDIKNVYTGYLVTLLLTDIPAATANLNSLPSSILRSFAEVGIKLKAYTYRLFPSSNIIPPVGYDVGFQLLVCAYDLEKLQTILGNPPHTNGPLSSFPALSPIAANVDPTTATTITFQEAVVISTRCTSSFYLREKLLAYIIGAGFTVNSFNLLGKNIILTAVPRDISPYFDAKLIIGSFLPLLGIKCNGEKHSSSSSLH